MKFIVILILYFTFAIASSVGHRHGKDHHRRRHRQNGCVHNEARNALICQCASEYGQESWRIPSVDGYSLRRINLECCDESQPLELERFLRRVGNFRGSVHVDGGCCYNGRIPSEVSVVGAEQCETTRNNHYAVDDELSQGEDRMMGDAPSSYNENSENVVVESINVDETGMNGEAEMRQNNRRRNRNRTRYPRGTCDLDGLWYNEHGSELYLQQSSDGKLTGEYRTAVEVECGSAGKNYSVVNGSIVGRLFSFHVHWNSKKSVTSWIGQCHESCEHGFLPIGAEPMLHTTWVLTSETDDCNDAWMQNRIGQNVFTRRQLKKGPRKLDGTHLPNRNQ